MYSNDFEFTFYFSAFIEERSKALAKATMKEMTMKEKISQLEEEVSRLQQQSKSYSDTAIQTVPEEEAQRRNTAVMEANICVQMTFHFIFQHL